MQYDLIQRLSLSVNLLEKQLAILTTELGNISVRQATVFELPPALKGEELLAVDAIKVTRLQGKEALDIAIRHYTRLFIHQQPETVSTRSATRLPGVICLAASGQQHQTLLEIITAINQSKQALEYLITKESKLTSEARFSFVHQHCPGLITLNAYRQIPFVSLPQSVNFGWANKHFIKRTCKAEVIEKLRKSLDSGRTNAPWTRAQWRQLVQNELDIIQALADNVVLKYKRPIKVQPIVRLWYAANQKQQQFACPSPLLMTCEKTQQLPTIGQLNDFDRQTITHRFRPGALPLRLVIPRLSLWQQECER